MKYTSNILQNHICMSQSISVYIFSQNQVIQLLSFSWFVIDFGGHFFFAQFFIYTHTWMKKNKMVHASNTICYSIPFILVYLLYVHIPCFFLTYQLMFMFILFCTFRH
jgi:hypothetical protein